MKATIENIGETFKIRLLTYNSIRHYGGRHITPHASYVYATLIALQEGSQPYIVTLNSDAKDYKGMIQFNKGHKIAIGEKDLIEELKQLEQ